VVTPGSRARARAAAASATAAVALGVVLTAAACAGPRSGIPTASDSASTATSPTISASGTTAVLSPSCPAPPTHEATVTVEGLNRALSGTLDLPAWQAADIGASARLTDGRIVWLFGDTVRPDLQPTVVANSMLVSSGRCVSQLVDPARGPVIPDAAPGVVRWPMSVVVLTEPGHDALVVLCSRIDRGHTGAFGFTYLGSSAAVFTVEPRQAPRLDRVVDITPDSQDETQVDWGAASTVSGSWVYVYGTRLTGRTGDVGRELYVARAPVSGAGDRSAWRFWDGSTWQADRERAVAVLPSQGGVSQTLSVQATGGGFVAVRKRNGDTADFVYKWTAPRATGPWTPTKELSAPAGYDTGKLEYAPLAHPEVPLASGDLLVSISRNTTDLARLVADPQVGRPEFAQITP
jgi:hypothetical protein